MGMLSIIKNVPAKAVATLGKVSMKLGKNKPQIMVYGGAVVATTGFILAIVNAMKVREKMAESEGKLDDLNNEMHALTSREQALTSEEVTIVKQFEKDIHKEKIHAAIMIGEMIGIPCLLFVGGMSLSLGGHMILVKRFGQLSTAFATLQQTFERYRQLNIAEHGEECDRRYRYGIVETTTTTATVTDDNGKTKTIKCKVPVVDEDKAASMYTFCFSEDFSHKCPKDPVNMISFLRGQEKYWNTWMDSYKRPVTLYMVLNDLGFEIDTDDPSNDYIMIAGWRPNGDGDNHIDFGIMRAVNKPALDMLSNVCFLNFNCDGNLYHSSRYDKDGRKVC